MYKKRGVLVFVGLILLLSSVFVDARIPEQPSGSNLVDNSNALQCSDGTLFGSCNSEGFLCASDINLLNEEDITHLVNSKKYLFFAETNCFNPVVKLNGNRIAFSKTGKRIVSQFTSTGGAKLFTIECDGVEEEFGNAYLGEVENSARLIKDCGLCSCPEDETEKLKEYVLVNNLAGVNSLSTESYRNVGRAKIAVNNRDLNLCEFENAIDSVTCIQQVFDFNCDDVTSLVGCREGIIGTSDIAINPNFQNGRLLSRGGELNEFGNVFYDDWSIRNGDEVSRSTDKCDTKSSYNSGGVFGFFKKSSSYRFEVDHGRIFKKEVLERVRGEYTLLNTFSQDLLCGYDDYWYLCDKEGFKIFDNGEVYYCREGAWIKL